MMQSKYRKLILIGTAIISLLVLSGCEETYVYPTYPPCREDIDYNFHRVLYDPFGCTIELYFDIFCPESQGYYMLVYDPFHGTEYINGKRWTITSNVFSYAPIYSYSNCPVGPSGQTYRCIIKSTTGNVSEEFYISI